MRSCYNFRRRLVRNSQIRFDETRRFEATGQVALYFVRVLCTWEEAHEIFKENECMKAGLKALQNTSFSIFRDSEDGNPSPGAC